MTALVNLYELEKLKTRCRNSKNMKSEVASVPGVMGGDPVIVGTRILAETILSYLRADGPAEKIHANYPSLPADGVEAVIRWAEMTYGPDWKPKT